MWGDGVPPGEDPSLECCRPLKVEVLKPDSVLRDERVPIEEMNSVFSGGQELTAATLPFEGRTIPT